MSKHFIVESGVLYAPPDEVQVARSLEDAVTIATEWAELSTAEQADLAVLGHVYLNITTVGSDYIELYECGCQHPELHSARVERRSASQDSASRIPVSVI